MYFTIFSVIAFNLQWLYLKSLSWAIQLWNPVSVAANDFISFPKLLLSLEPQQSGDFPDFAALALAESSAPGCGWLAVPGSAPFFLQFLVMGGVSGLS